ncbi:MAG: class I SAM-dependent methyltransferase [Saprospiraceae bacterium]
MHPDFENRLRKVHRHIAKWAKRLDLSCYRIYDADIPSYPFAIDRYGDMLHAAEYARNHGMDDDAHSQWLEECLDVMGQVLDTPRERIFLKFRQRQKGLSQYEIFARQGAEAVVTENGLRFIVNLSDYLDTGLFLDHRNTRMLARQMSAGKRALNLFAYTGAFSVYAAAGGATETLTLDLSNTYLEWAGRNLALNGFHPPAHRTLQADVLEWLRHPSAPSGWDLIVLDPPTFSNSKRMRDVLDIQRDHPELIRRCMRLLAPDGVLIFSTNARRFRLSEAIEAAYTVEEISRRTVPEDFRNKKIHRCFLIRASATPQRQGLVRR